MELPNFNKSYYYLVAGLSDLAIDAENKGFDGQSIRAEISEQLSKRDRQYLVQFYQYFDIQNIVNALSGKTTHNPMGNMTAEQVAQGVEDPNVFPKYIANIILGYRYANGKDAERDELTVDVTVPLEKALWQAFYALTAKSSCKFIHDWYAFDMDVRNICAGYTSRAQMRDIAAQLVGSGDVVEALTRSSATDFGLRGELEYVDDLIQIMEIPNILDKERRLDLLRWNCADDLAVSDYFNINRILSYMVKVNIIDRWLHLDADAGRQMFAKLMDELQAQKLVDQKTEDIVMK